MPRPGPRPYECVRRAWHSDRHQPMRGSIIQQIFRVVNENHSPVTKKNKEWQEKLPIVVLKAEEIMYSKANSEVEYMNPETLWDRLNDAVNTIIRRDESSESGELLPPCVEAALNLGCVPVRASRSQRHANPRTYLTPRGQEPASTLATTLDKATDERRLPISSLRPGNQLNFPRAATMNSSMFASERSSQVRQHNNPTIPSNPAFMIENVPVVHNNYSVTETNDPLNLGSVYPLYDGIRCQTEEPNLGSQISADANQRTIFLGRPIIASAEPAEHSLRSPKTGNAISRFPSEVITASEEKLPDIECDLSLRLGVPSQPCVSTRKTWAPETGDIGSSRSIERRKFHDQTIYASKEFSFFPSRTAFDPFGSCSNIGSSDGRGQNPESSTKKRKEPFNSNEEVEPFCFLPEAPSNWFDSQNKGPGIRAEQTWKSSYRQVKKMLPTANMAADKAFDRREAGAELGAGAAGVFEPLDLTVTLNFCPNEQWEPTEQIKYLVPAVSRGIVAGLVLSGVPALAQLSYSSFDTSTTLCTPIHLNSVNQRETTFTFIA